MRFPLLRIFRRHHEEARKTVYTPPKHYREVRLGSISDLENPLDTEHELIRSEKLKEIAKQLLVRKRRGVDYRESMRRAFEWVVTNLEYDDVHAVASRLWRGGFNLIYQRADEVVKTRRGICGELSLVLVKLLREMGIPAVLVRPSVSHLAVLCKLPDREEYYLLDPTTGHVKKIPKREALKRYISPSGKYVVGVVSLDEFRRQTVTRRRRKVEEIGLTPEEALDLEYALLCVEDLPFNTELGRSVLRYLKEVGYCMTTFTQNSNDFLKASQFFETVWRRCGKVNVEDVILGVLDEDYVECVRNLWETEFPELNRELIKEIEELEKELEVALHE